MQATVDVEKVKQVSKLSHFVQTFKYSFTLSITICMPNNRPNMRCRHSTMATLMSRLSQEVSELTVASSTHSQVRA